jgi:hypothetical protein
MPLKPFSYLKKAFSRVRLLFKSVTPPKKEDLIAYSSLSPIDDADQNSEYEKALYWALKNRKTKDIKNIALTGPYGSGKSSILKTFQKIYKQGDLKFLNISLATFKEEEKKLILPKNSFQATSLNEQLAGPGTLRLSRLLFEIINARSSFFICAGMLKAIYFVATFLLPTQRPCFAPCPAKRRCWKFWP